MTNQHRVRIYYEFTIQKDTRYKREWKGKIKNGPGTSITSGLSLVGLRYKKDTNIC